MAFIALTQRQPRRPRLALADAAAVTYAQQESTRRAARAKRPLNRIVRFVSMAFAVLFLAIALIGGTGAQKASAAWWWNEPKNVAAGVLNWCGPENVPVPASRLGLDTELFGLGKDSKGKIPQINADKATSATVTAASGGTTSGIDRLTAIFKDATHIKSVRTNGYASYGISTLQWTNYGAGCMSDGFALTGVSNLLLTFLVVLPAVLAMALVSFALNGFLYSGFAAMVEPMVSALSNIVQPWMWVIVLCVGLPMVWLRSKGSLSRLLSATAWVALIGSLFVYLNYNTSSVMKFANNAVANVSSFAACTFLQNPDLSSGSALLKAGNDGTGNLPAGSIKQTGSGGCSTDIVGNVIKGTSTTFNMADSGIAQQIWYDIPYRVWSMGEVGPDQASQDRALEADGKVSWSAAILNGLYANPSKDTSILSAVGRWNAGSYGPSDDDNGKVAYWTDPQGADGWKGAAQPAVEVPFLATVKAMCADTTPGTGAPKKSGEAEDNKWMYSGSCDTATAGTANVVQTFSGNAFEQRASAAFSGGISMYIILMVIGTVSIYLSFQKLAFFFLWMFAPLLLAIGAFPDEKRSAFAKKFGEQVVANVVKQVVAVVALLFVVSSIGSILGNSAIPWMMKPMSIISFWIAMLIFAIPFTRVLRAAAKGDASIVKKIADAPANAVKKTAVAAAVVGAAAVAAPALIGAAGGLGSMGGMSGLLKAAPKALGPAMQGLGRMKGGHSGMAIRRIGSMFGSLSKATAIAKAQHMQDVDGITALDTADRAKMGKIDPTTGLPERASRFDRVGGTGALTDVGKKQALTEWRQQMKQADGIVDPDRRAKMARETFFSTYQRTHDGQRHPLDPKFQEEAEKLGDAAGKMKDTAENLNEQSEKAAQEGAAAYDARPSYAKTSNVIADTQASNQRFGGDPAGAWSSSPTAFVTQYTGGPAYDLSGVAAMDITHPAMQNIMRLSAGQADGTLDTAASASLASEIAGQIKEYGAPAHVSHYGLADATVADFDANQLKNMARVIPALTDDSLGADARYETATRIAAVAANMPSDHALRVDVSTAMNNLWSGDGTEAVSAINRLSEQVHSYIAVNQGGAGAPAEAVNFSIPQHAGAAPSGEGGFFAPARAAAPQGAPVVESNGLWGGTHTEGGAVGGAAPAAAVPSSTDTNRLADSVDRLTDATQRSEAAALRSASEAARLASATSAQQSSTSSLADATRSQAPSMERVSEQLRATREAPREVSVTENPSDDLPPEAIDQRFRPGRNRKKTRSIFTDAEDEN